MDEPTEAFEQANAKLSNIKVLLSINELQFQRIKSTINRMTVWNKEFENSILDFMKECDDDKEMKRELNFRYETSKLATASAKDLWNQLNRCADRKFSKEELLIIINGFIEHYEVFANHFNNGEDTEALSNLRKTLAYIK